MFSASTSIITEITKCQSYMSLHSSSNEKIVRPLGRGTQCSKMNVCAAWRQNYTFVKTKDHVKRGLGRMIYIIRETRPPWADGITHERRRQWKHSCCTIWTAGKMAPLWCPLSAPGQIHKRRNKDGTWATNEPEGMKMTSRLSKAADRYPSLHLFLKNWILLFGETVRIYVRTQKLVRLPEDGEYGRERCGSCCRRSVLQNGRKWPGPCSPPTHAAWSTRTNGWGPPSFRFGSFLWLPSGRFEEKIKSRIIKPAAHRSRPAFHFQGEKR